ncbi:hypothetical protein DL93DRAFT_1139864 [Clavulina sp. PMI_390]|nr:hypothetical protein DL93DRAFT_1139864 [Clavulina sp. PMI_390]
MRAHQGAATSSLNQTLMQSPPDTFVPSDVYRQVCLTAVEDVNFVDGLKAAMTKKAAAEDMNTLTTCPICQSKLKWSKRHVEEGHIVSLSSRLLQGATFDSRTDLVWLILMAIRLQRRAPKNRPHPREARREADELLHHLSVEVPERPFSMDAPALRAYGYQYAMERAPNLMCSFCPEKFTRPETKVRHERTCPHRGEHSTSDPDTTDNIRVTGSRLWMT